MSNTAITDLLSKRKDRACATILRVKEREADSYLPSHVQAKLRKVILDQLNEFHEMCVDVMRSLDTGDVVLNELYLEKIDEIHTVLMRRDPREESEIVFNEEGLDYMVGLGRRPR